MMTMTVEIRCKRPKAKSGSRGRDPLTTS